MIVYLQMLETSEEQVRFEELVHTYKNLMFYVANQVLNNDYDAEDAVQQAFFAILKNFEKISEIKCPQTRSFVVTILLGSSFPSATQLTHCSMAHKAALLS